MNARELLARIESARIPDIGYNKEAKETILRALRLLAAADEEGTPEVDAAAERGSDHGLGGAMMSGIWPLARRLERERNAAIKALAECREDAERYRWLRDNKPDYRGLVAVIDLRSNVDAWLYGTYLDAAIDAAREAK